MSRLEQIGTGMFAPLGGEAREVLGGTASATKLCIGGYTVIDGQLYPDYVEDFDAAAPAATAAA